MHPNQDNLGNTRKRMEAKKHILDIIDKELDKWFAAGDTEMGYPKEEQRYD